MFVQQVNPGGPADKAGVQASDIIVGVNGKPIESGDELVQTISAAQPGETVHLKLLRDGKPTEVSVKIGDRAEIVADNGSGKEPGEGGEGEATHTRLGVSVQNLTESDREQVGLKTGGVVVASVEPGSFAEDIGLQKGDVIVEINRHRVTTVRRRARHHAIGQAGRSHGVQADAECRWELESSVRRRHSAREVKLRLCGAG